MRGTPLDASLLEGVRALTFDCYGTIIDWDGGIRDALDAVPSLEGCDLEQLVADREREEYELLAGPFRLYGEVLGESMRRAARLQGREPSEAARERFVSSMGSWPPFPESKEALARLARRFSLAILSNVESATLRRSISGLGVEFDPLVTAEEVRSYKPARTHFDEGLRRLGLARDQVLHVAGSLYHDVRPARDLGWNAVWINRRAEAAPEDVDPERIWPDLAGLADALEC